METIANFKTKEYEIKCVDEKQRKQGVKQNKTDKEYFLIVCDIDLVEKNKRLEEDLEKALNYAKEFREENQKLKRKVVLFNS